MGESCAMSGGKRTLMAESQSPCKCAKMDDVTSVADLLEEIPGEEEKTIPETITGDMLEPNHASDVLATAEELLDGLLIPNAGETEHPWRPDTDKLLRKSEKFLITENLQGFSG